MGFGQRNPPPPKFNCYIYVLSSLCIFQVIFFMMKIAGNTRVIEEPHSTYYVASEFGVRSSEAASTIWLIG